MGADEVLEGEGGGEPGLEREWLRRNDVEQGQRITGLQLFLLEGTLGCEGARTRLARGQHYVPLWSGMKLSTASRATRLTFAVLMRIQSGIQKLRDVADVSCHLGQTVLMIAFGYMVRWRGTDLLVGR